MERITLSAALAVVAAHAMCAEPCGPPETPPRPYHQGRIKVRPYTACDRRALLKRVAKRRAKKGYAC